MSSVTDADFGNDERLTEQRVQAAIVRSFTRVAWENCAPTPDAAPEPTGMKKVEIVYPPGTWSKMQDIWHSPCGNAARTYM